MVDKIEIRAERDSVCIGDDWNAPNTKYLSFGVNARLSDLASEVCRYVPAMSLCVWSIRSGEETLAYLASDESAQYEVRLNMPDTTLSSLGIEVIFCRYYTQSEVELGGHPEEGTLVEKIAAREAEIRRLRLR